MADAIAQQYPATEPYLDNYTFSMADALEFYPQGETHSPNSKQNIVQYPQGTSVRDLAGEIVSHDLVQGRDPGLTSAYQQFGRGLERWQRDVLSGQYDWEQAQFGEDRPFGLWSKYSGMPGYFRGGLFRQWPQEEFTQGQSARFDKLRRQLRGR